MPSNGARLEAVVFDFDGTLAELRLDFADMKQRLALLASGYLDGVPEPHLPVLEWLEFLEARIFSNNEAGARELRSRATRMIVEMELEAARNGVLFAYTRSILKHLRLHGIHAAIITRNCEEAVRTVFPDLEDFCGCFLAREHVERVKPDPEHLHRALDRLGADPGNSLMVGDHPLDVLTGKAAGTLTAGVASGSGSWDDLTRSGADWVAPDCESLFEVLRSAGLI